VKFLGMIFLLLFATMQIRNITASLSITQEEVPPCMRYEQARQKEAFLNEQILVYKQMLEPTSPYVLGLFSVLVGSFLFVYIAEVYVRPFDQAFAYNLQSLGLLNCCGSFFSLLIFWDEGTPIVSRITPEKRRDYQEKIITLRYQLLLLQKCGDARHS